MPNESFLSDFATLPVSSVLLWVWFGLVVVFLVHWLIAGYHWYVYGSERAVSLLSIIIYGGGGVFVLLTMGGLLLAM